jgi:hypothetical protein
MQGTKLVFLSLLFLIASSSLDARDSWTGVSRIVAIGDVHGDYEQLISVLEMSGIIDKKGRWSAGKTHLVQAGDIPDRGPDTAKIIRFFMKLEKQAAKKGGYAHLLIGNHEAMNMIGDLRYVHEGEYSALTSKRSQKLRNAYYDRTVKWLRKNSLPEQMPVFDQAYREKFDKRFPLGYVEHRQIWDRSGEFGKWVKDHNAVIRINDVLFVHGGIGPTFVEESIQKLNRQVSGTLSGPVTDGSIVEHSDGPLWYRGLANNDEESERPHLEALLALHQVNRIVIAHSVTEGAIKPRFDGQVILIDTGMAAHYGSHKAALVIEEGSYSVIHRGVSMPLPLEGGDELINYFETVMELESDQARLQNLIDSLKNPQPVATPPALPGVKKQEQDVSS